jgi:hypothetical protein
VRQPLVYAILIGSAVGVALAEVILFRMYDPPELAAAVIGGLWVAMPYLAAAGLTLPLRRHGAALVVLLVALLLAGGVGVSVLNASASQQEAAQQQVRDAVQPGEDPSSGPAGMRKAGAEAGADIAGVFSILVVLVVPPVQLAAVVFPALIAWGVSALARRRKEASVGEPVGHGEGR